jgi:hypothetical protein
MHNDQAIFGGLQAEDGATAHGQECSQRFGVGARDRASASTTKRIRQLERELARKEKALAEAAALLVLKEKTGELLRGGRGRRHERGERQVMLSAVAEARASGARLEQACRVIGLSTRTIERWRREPERGDGRRSRYAGLSPKQLATACGRRPLSCVGIDHLSCAATIRAAGAEASPEANPRHPRVHDSPSDWPQPGLELGHHVAPDDRVRRVPPPVPRDGCLEPPHRRMASLRARVRSTPTTVRRCAEAR